MPIQVIFFDFGSTLIYSKGPWPSIFVRSDAALLRVLLEAGIQLDNPTFPDDFGSFLDAYYSDREADLIERTTYTALKDLLGQKGYVSVPDPVLRAALNAMYAITRSNWCIEDDALPTLRVLKEAGYRLGLISNASDDQNVQKQVDQWGFRPYFDFIITSAACGMRKPHPHIFQIALDHFNVPPIEAAMVGDTLSADVLGANQMGMLSIWITRRVSARSIPSILPKAVVNTLSELPPLFYHLNDRAS